MSSIYKTDVDQSDLVDLRCAVMALDALRLALYNAGAHADEEFDLMGLSYLMDPHVKSIDAIEKKLTEASDAAEQEAWKKEDSGTKVVRIRKNRRTA